MPDCRIQEDSEGDLLVRLLCTGKIAQRFARLSCQTKDGARGKMGPIKRSKRPRIGATVGHDIGGAEYRACKKQEKVSCRSRRMVKRAYCSGARHRSCLLGRSGRGKLPRHRGMPGRDAPVPSTVMAVTAAYESELEPRRRAGVHAFQITGFETHRPTGFRSFNSHARLSLRTGSYCALGGISITTALGLVEAFQNAQSIPAPPHA